MTTTSPAAIPLRQDRLAPAARMLVPAERLGGAVARVVSGRALRRSRRQADRGASARCRRRRLPHRRHRARGARPLLASRRRAQPRLGGGRHHRLPLSRLPLRARRALHAGAGASRPSDLAEAPHRDVPDGGALRPDLVHAQRPRREPAGVRGVGRSRRSSRSWRRPSTSTARPDARSKASSTSRISLGRTPSPSARARARSCRLTKSSAPRAAFARSM